MNRHDTTHYWRNAVKNHAVTDADLRKWVDTIQREGRGLTTWEEEFIDDCARRLDYGGYTFSQKQREIIERICAEKTPT